MRYSLNNITESFMDKINKVRRENDNPLGRIRQAASDSLEIIPFSCPLLGRWMADNFNHGQMFTYKAAAELELEFDPLMLDQFEYDTKMDDFYTFNELKYFKKAIYGGNPATTDDMNSTQNRLLREIALPEAWTDIPETMFVNYTGLEKVTFGRNVKSFGRRCFYGCVSLNDIVIPESTVKIGNEAFAETRITSAVIPSGVTNLPSGLFYSCKKLVSVSLPETISKIDEYTFAFCDNLISVNIPYSVREIIHNAFQECLSLKTVVLPPNLEKIEQSFGSCDNLEEVDILSKSLKEITPADVFWQCHKLKKVEVHSEMTIKNSNYAGDQPISFDLFVPDRLREFYESQNLPNRIDCIKSVIYYQE